MNTHSRLRAALTRVTESNDRAEAAERSIARLNSTASAVAPLQEKLDALTLQDAAAFDAWARAGDGSEAPEVDVAAHDAARLSIVAAQARAAAIAGPLATLQQGAALIDAAKAKAEIGPLGLHATLSTAVPTLLAELSDLRSAIVTKSTQVDVARALLIDSAEALKAEAPNSPAVSQLYTLNEKLGEAQRAGYEVQSGDDKAIRDEWTKAVNRTIQENA
jgi:hypothetical protein